MQGTKVLAVGCAVLLVGFLVVTGAAFASGGNSINAKVCQKGGWASPNLQDGTGQPLTFASQDDCVAFGASGGQVFNPSLAGVPSHVGAGQESFWVASGFHPSSAGTLTQQTLGGSDGSITFPATTTATGGLPALVGTFFELDACALGITGVQITLVDGFGVHATATISLDCP